MTQDYVNAKIAEALKATGGDKRDAQKLLITWAVRDPTLLLGLVKPNLKGVVAARIEEAAHPKRKSAGGDHLTKESIESIVSSATPGEKRAARVVPPPKSSARQASAIHQLVAAFKKKK